jgi:uncharacterized membrane protein YdjX (TVP38/TMEM64 family)
MRNKKQLVKEVIISPGFLILILVLLLGIFLQSLLLDHLERVKEIISSYGLLGPLIFILLLALSTIFAPINNFLIWLPGFYIFGPERSFIFSFVGGLIGGLSAFLIARKFGRPIVKKIIGKKGMERIDKLTEDLGGLALWLLMIFGTSLFDFVSYAAGLTNIKIKKFFAAILLGPLPLTLLLYLLIKNSHDLLTVVFISGVISVIGLSISSVLLFFLHKRIRKGFSI